MEGWHRVTARLKTFGARDIAITAVFSGLGSSFSLWLPYPCPLEDSGTLATP